MSGGFCHKNPLEHFLNRKQEPGEGSSSSSETYISDNIAKKKIIAANHLSYVDNASILALLELGTATLWNAVRVHHVNINLSHSKSADLGSRKTNCLQFSLSIPPAPSQNKWTKEKLNKCAWIKPDVICYGSMIHLEWDMVVMVRQVFENCSTATSVSPSFVKNKLCIGIYDMWKSRQNKYYYFIWLLYSNGLKCSFEENRVTQQTKWGQVSLRLTWAHAATA